MKNRNFFCLFSKMQLFLRWKKTVKKVWKEIVENREIHKENFRVSDKAYTCVLFLFCFVRQSLSSSLTNTIVFHAIFRIYKNLIFFLHCIYFAFSSLVQHLKSVSIGLLDKWRKLMIYKQHYSNLVNVIWTLFEC